MTISVGFLEIGELGLKHERSLYKTIIITVLSLFVMGFVGFNIAFGPTYDGIIGNPFYTRFFLGLFSTSFARGLTSVYWITGASYFNTGLFTGTFFLFETACASVTLALVGVVVLKKVKLSSFAIFSVFYFAVIWTLPAAWIWNPSGWLYLMGVRDFAGGLVVHGAAGFAALAILVRIWQEEKKTGLKESKQVGYNLNSGWLTLAILLLWIGWFGFNPGTELGFSSEAIVVVIATFLSAAASMITTVLIKYFTTKKDPGLLYAVNGILMGLIVITPLAGYVSPGSAVVIGLLSGPLFLLAEWIFNKPKWFSDPVGVLECHLAGGVTGLLLIGFFTQTAFASASGASNLPQGLLFGGGFAALHQLGLEAFAVVVVGAFAFAVSYAVIFFISKISSGVLIKEEYARILF